MKRLVSLILSTLIFSGVILGRTEIKANAYDVLGGNFTGDLSSAMCYYNSEYGSIYGVRTMRGATGWNYQDLITFDLHWSYGSSLAVSDVYVTKYSNTSDGVNAYTTFYQRNSSGLMTQVNPHNSDWNFCVIKLNTAYNPDYVTMMHEFGHVMGLDDNNDEPTSVMCQAVAGRTATRPSVVDMLNLNYLHG